MGNIVFIIAIHFVKFAYSYEFIWSILFYDEFRSVEL